MREIIESQATSLEADQVADAFRTAGLGKVRTAEIVADVRLPAIAEFVREHLLASPTGQAVGAARPDGLDMATGSIVKHLAGWTDPDGSATVPFASMLITGIR